MKLNFNLKELPDVDIVAEINVIQADIEITEKQLTKLKEYKKQLEIAEYAENNRPYSKKVFDYVDAILTPLVFEPPHKFNIISQDGKIYDISKHGYYVMIEPLETDPKYHCYAMGAMTGAFKTYGRYKNLERFEEVINELAETIKRGDEKFTFPADEEEEA